MAIEAPTEGRSEAAHRDLRLAELVAFGLLVVEALAILGYVAAGIANQAQFGGDNTLSVLGAHAWGYTLSLASGWSAPWAVAVFLFGPLALVAWIGRRQGDVASSDRSRLVLQLELVLAVLTAVGGIVAIVGRVMQVSPPQQWSAFLAALGTGMGSVCLGLLAVVVVRWLANDLQIDLFTRPDADVFGQEAAN